MLGRGWRLKASSPKLKFSFEAGLLNLLLPEEGETVGNKLQPQSLLNISSVLYRLWFVLNFVETMAMQRLFLVGRFKCSNITPKITIGNFLGDGYVVVIRKDTTKNFCIQCVKQYFSNKKGLNATESKKYLTISNWI